MWSVVFVLDGVGVCKSWIEFSPVCCYYKAPLKRRGKEGRRKSEKLLDLNQPGLNSKQNYKGVFLHVMFPSFYSHKVVSLGEDFKLHTAVFLY